MISLIMARVNFAVSLLFATCFGIVSLFASDYQIATYFIIYTIFFVLAACFLTLDAYIWMVVYGYGGEDK